jgi:hypothetical protein
MTQTLEAIVKADLTGLRVTLIYQHEFDSQHPNQLATQ